ncbi:hypothetical protein MVG78_13040 [Roseomonas gilardii subsp. gilardii]|uniref:hypothetical protein n=1 Tax=Roseomonas gilardii TaxID=257708 RepID=UPI001FF7594E|nr:hypothetical protein [Roseomonas gilardii]UPG71490.1 hypothetical protein MVG78_13040 [Roseomonas gilardii subsp. gilardii]
MLELSRGVEPLRGGVTAGLLLVPFPTLLLPLFDVSRGVELWAQAGEASSGAASRPSMVKDTAGFRRKRASPDGPAAASTRRSTRWGPGAAAPVPAGREPPP